MRKYQQLFLVVISILSVGILLVYKSENNRLKYVLQVVNLFGRADTETALRHLENSTRLLSTEQLLPVWQRLSSGLHVYSSFWHKNQLAVGGEVISIVVGLEHAIVNFKCELQYPGNKVVAGKFGFIRVEYPDHTNSKKNQENYIIYKFLCKVSKNFVGTPQNIIFTDNQFQVKHAIPIKNMTLPDGKNNKNLMTICLDLNNYNSNYRGKEIKPTNLLQFFISHHFIGVDEFYIYNHHGLDTTITEYLYKNTIKFNILTYNFPFDLSDKNKNRQLIEMDCLMRTSGSSRYSIVSHPNEYFYPNGNLKPSSNLVKYLNDNSINTNRFEIEQINVCTDELKKQTLQENFYEDYDKRTYDWKFYIYKPNYLSNTSNNNVQKILPIDLNMAMQQTYKNCDDQKNIRDWRTSVKSDFVKFIQEISNEIKTII